MDNRVRDQDTNRVLHAIFLHPLKERHRSQSHSLRLEDDGLFQLNQRSAVFRVHLTSFSIRMSRSALMIPLRTATIHRAIDNLESRGPRVERERLESARDLTVGPARNLVQGLSHGPMAPIATCGTTTLVPHRQSSSAISSTLTTCRGLGRTYSFRRERFLAHRRPPPSTVQYHLVHLIVLYNAILGPRITSTYMYSRGAQTAYVCGSATTYSTLVVNVLILPPHAMVHILTFLNLSSTVRALRCLRAYHMWQRDEAFPQRSSVGGLLTKSLLCIEIRIIPYVCLRI
ncbi:hypothetical protein C8Q77DRAFT_1123785 [Trametes polyzona]|nr:hypothetical protein C8Q77DRAFT_1123785 [Trametes polyzona]